MNRVISCAGALLGSALAIACSSSASPASPARDARADGAAVDAGKGASDGGGDAGAFAPAFKPDMPTIQSAGGKMLAAPKIVTVTFDGDPNRAGLEDFDDKLTVSQFWKDTVGEYGVGAGSAGAHVHVASAPPGPDPLAISDWIRAELESVAPADGGAASGWPAPDDATIYVVYVPSAAKMSPSTVKHSELTVGTAHVPYVMVDEGATEPGLNELDAATANASHDIAEAATNPHLSTDPALGAFDGAHLAWQALTQDQEIGDICEMNADANYKGAGDLPYGLQRLWSNKSAAAGENPCVPRPSDPYYNVAPIGLENVSVFMGTANAAASGYGYQVPLGQKKAIKLGFFSDQPVGPWTITAAEGSWFSPASNARLTITVDQGTGKNGDVGQITVTANAKAPGDGNAVLVTITSQAPGLPAHTMPILIGTYP